MEEFKRYYDYDVYNDGRVYSHHVDRFLKGDIVQGYLQYSLYIDNTAVRIKAHRLVGMLFLPLPDNYKDLVINHIDGNKLNNNYSNLEWTTYYGNNKHARDTGLNNISESNSKRWKDNDFRERLSEKFSKVFRERQTTAWKNNGRFRYLIKIGDKEYTRSELAKIIEKSQSYTDALIKKAASGTIIPIFIANNIQIIDTERSKVNRLSKAVDNEENVA